MHCTSIHCPPALRYCCVNLARKELTWSSIRASFFLVWEFFLMHTITCVQNFKISENTYGMSLSVWECCFSKTKIIIPSSGVFLHHESRIIFSLSIGIVIWSCLVICGIFYDEVISVIFFVLTEKTMVVRLSASLLMLARYAISASLGFKS